MAKQKPITKLADVFTNELNKLKKQATDTFYEEAINSGVENYLPKNKGVSLLTDVAGQIYIESNNKKEEIIKILQKNGVGLLTEEILKKFFPQLILPDVIADTAGSILTDNKVYTSKNKSQRILTHIRDGMWNAVVTSALGKIAKVDFETELATLGIKGSDLLTTLKFGTEALKAGTEGIVGLIGETIGGLGKTVLSSSSSLINTGKTMASSSLVNTGELIASDANLLLGPYAPAITDLLSGKADMTPWKDLGSYITTGKPTKKTQDEEKAEQELCEESYVFSDGEPNPFYGEQQYGKHNPNYNVDNYSKKDLNNLKKELDSGSSVLSMFGDTSGNRILEVMKKIYPDFNYKKRWWYNDNSLAISDKFNEYSKKVVEHPVLFDKYSYDTVHNDIKKDSKLLNFNKLIYPKYYFNTPSTTLPKIVEPMTGLLKLPNITPKYVKGNYSLTEFDPNVFKKRAITKNIDKTKNNKLRVVKLTPKRPIYYKNVYDPMDVNKLFNSLRVMLREQIAVSSEGAH